jgi:hypothetical protein
MSPESVRDRVIVFPLGLSNTEGVMNLHLSSDDACGSLMPPHPEAPSCSNSVRSMAVPVVRLDSILDMLPLEYDLLYLKAICCFVVVRDIVKLLNSFHI